MKIVINPQYLSLSGFIKSLPENFDNTGEFIYNERNQIKKYEVEGLDIAVKSFKIPILINRIAYTFFRKSKAARSYIHGLGILKRGFSTPAPVAYIETRKCGLMYRSFYISIYDKEKESVRRLMANEDKGDTSLILKDFAHFVAGMHQAGILHIDLSPGNILMSKDSDNRYHFSIIDINRLLLKNHISRKEALQNFERLCLSKEISTQIAGFYAKERGWDEEETVAMINKYSDAFFLKICFRNAQKDIRKESGLLKSLFGPIQEFKRTKDAERKKYLYDKYLKNRDWRGCVESYVLHRCSSSQ